MMATYEEIAELVKLLLLELANISIAPSSTVATHPDFEARGDYKLHDNKYSSKSGNAIELLKQSKAAFEGDKLDAPKAGTNAKNAHAPAGDAFEERNGCS